MSCLFSQQPKTLPSLCWFIVALKGPALADVRQMALDMLSIQRPQTAHLQKRKVTVAQKLSKLQWYEEKSVRDWKERTAHGYRMLQLQETQQGKKLVMKQMNQRTTLPFSTSTAATHHHVLLLQRSQQTAQTLSVSLFLQSFLSALGKESPWVSVSCTLAFLVCLYCKISRTIFWCAFQIPSFHFDDNDGPVCSDQWQGYHY